MFFGGLLQCVLWFSFCLFLAASRAMLLASDTVVKVINKLADVAAGERNLSWATCRTLLNRCCEAPGTAGV